MGERDRIGTLHPTDGIGRRYRTVCGVRECGWAWTGDRDQAEANLRGHVSLSHPQPIPIYREEVRDA